MAGPLSLQEQVATNIATVRAARSSAIQKLEGRFWQTDAVEAALSVLKRDTIGVEAWASRGVDGVAAGKAPGAGGWVGWIDAGKVLLDGIASQVDEANTATLANIEQTTADVKADVKRVGAKAAATAKAVGGAVGDTAAATLKPLMPALSIGVLALGALALLKFGGRK